VAVARRVTASWPPPQVASLPGGRLHLQHGPIDLVIMAEGGEADRSRAYAAAIERFRTILGELVGELPLLRRPLSGDEPPLAQGHVAQRMIHACWPHRRAFITPMAAVAGSVADEIRTMMLAVSPGLRTLHVNNGGDIAVHVAPGEALRIGLVADLTKAAPEGVAMIIAGSGIGGIATSGWRGRSFSLGVADAVTVLARSAATADAAATLIANAVNVASPVVRRMPARTLDPDSDLGDTLVTTDVGALSRADIQTALASGLTCAEAFLAAGTIDAAAIALSGEWRVVGASSGLLPAMP
jgi:uncharacterized protein